MSLLLFLASCLVASTAADGARPVIPDEQRLLIKLFDSYDTSVRPVINSSSTVVVEVGFTLIQIMDMDEKNQVLITNAWLLLQWKDERISWNNTEFDHLNTIRIPAKLLWLPDIVLYNNADDYTTGFMPVNAMVDKYGTVFWSPPVRLRSSCKVDITFFPFDSQACRLKFGSWTYDKAQVDLARKSEVDLSNYVSNGEWHFSKNEIIRKETIYPIGDAIYPDVTVVLVIRRRILYYVLNIIFPCFWLNILSVLNFALPPDAGEKMTLGITVLLSYSVFMLLVAESMPPTSEFVPLIGIYLTISMAMSSVSVILAVMVMKLHHCTPNQREVPQWVRSVILKGLARLVSCQCFQRSRSRKKGKVNVKNGREPMELCTKLMKDGSISNPPHRRDLGRIPDISIRSEYARSQNSFQSDSGSDAHNHELHERKSFCTEEAIKYLRVLVAKSDEENLQNGIVDEWKQVALVIDRLLFWTFLFVTLGTVIVILVVVPAIRYYESSDL